MHNRRNQGTLCIFFFFFFNCCYFSLQRLERKVDVFAVVLFLKDKIPHFTSGICRQMVRKYQRVHLDKGGAKTKGGRRRGEDEGEWREDSCSLSGNELRLRLPVPGASVGPPAGPLLPSQMSPAALLSKGAARHDSASKGLRQYVQWRRRE